MADLPEATSRQDIYLKYIAENGSFSGGGGGSDIPLPVSIANGGTGATTEADARTNLDVYSKQEVDDKIPVVNVVQTTGTSETDVMSQKSVSTMTTIGEGATNANPSSSVVWGKNANDAYQADNSVVIGHNSSVNMSCTVNIGSGATSTYNDTVNIGYNANSTNGGVNIGSTATSDSYLGTNLGHGATALSGEGNINIGVYAKTKGEKNVNIGRLSKLNGELNVAIGNQTSLGDPNSEEPTDAITESTVIGNKATITSNYGVSIGSQANSQAENSIALGYKSVATEENTVSFGNDTITRRIVNVTDPTNPQDAATKKYVDNSTKNSLYNSPTMESGIDLNTKTTAGFYMVDSTCTSTPTYDSDYSLIVSTIGDTSQSDYPVFQMCIPTKTREDTSGSKHPTMYIRQKYLNVDTWQWTYWLNASVLVQNETGDSYEDTMSQYAITNNFISKNVSKISIGETSKASGTGGIAIGQSAESYQTGGISIGQYAFCPVPNSIALGANSQATEPNVLSVGNMDETRKIINVTDPTNAQDATTKNYVDPVVLYDNSSGTTGTITLSDTYTNYSRLQIYFMDNGAYNSSQMYTSSNRICLSNTYASVDTMNIVYWHSCLLSFSDTTATFERNSVSYLEKETTNLNFIISRNETEGLYVTKIVGYKY